MMKKVCYICIFLLLLLIGCSSDSKYELKISNSDQYNKYKIENIMKYDTCIGENVYCDYELINYNDGQLKMIKTVDTYNDNDDKISCNNVYYGLDINNKAEKKIIEENSYSDIYCCYEEKDEFIGIYLNDLKVYYKKYTNNNVINNICISDIYDEKYDLFDACIDENGIYVTLVNDDASEFCIYIFDHDLNELFVSKEKNPIDIYNNIKQGTLIHSWDKSTFYRFDFTAKKLVAVNKRDQSSMRFVSPGDQFYDYYSVYEDASNEKYFCGVKNGMAEKLFSYKNLGVLEMYSTCISDNEGGFFVKERRQEDNIINIIHLKKSDKEISIKDEKTIIKIATITDNWLSKYIDSFNINNSEYYVELKNYMEDCNDINEARKNIILDSKTDESFDMLYLYGMDKNDLVENGVLEDLNSYFRKSEFIDLNSFSENAQKVMVDNDNKIYSLITGYTITGLFGKNNYDNSKLFQTSPHEDDLIFVSCAGSDFLLEQIIYSQNKYINENEVNFSDDFRKILALEKNYIDKADMYVNEDPYVLIKDNKAELICDELLFPYHYFFLQKSNW